MTSCELTHFKKVVRVWKTYSLLFCLRYDPLIVFCRQNYITFIFIKMMSHDLLVQYYWPIVNIMWICPGLRKRGWTIATIRDTSSWHTCLKWLLLSTISFIYYFIPFKCRKSTHPKINVVWSKRKTWGSKIQHWFWREGVGVQRGRG